MAAAILGRTAQRRIEEAAARRQAAIDSGKDVIVGLNRFRLDHEAPLEVLEVDNDSVRLSQLARLKQLKESRDSAAVEAALPSLAERRGWPGQHPGNGRNGCPSETVGEMSLAMEKVFGRHKATPVAVSGSL